MMDNKPPQACGKATESPAGSPVTPGIPQEEDRNLALLHAIPDLVFLLDRSGRFIDFLSVRHEALFAEPEQFLNKTIATLFSPALADSLMDKINSLSKPGDLVTFVYEMQIGSLPGWFEARLTLCGPHVLALVRNVTSLHHVESQRRRIETMLTESQRIAHLGSWEWNIETNQLFWSEETYRIFGVSPETFHPSIESFVAMIHPDDRDYVKNQIRDSIDNKKPYSLEHRIRLPDGRIRIIHEQGNVFYDPAGKPYRTLGTAFDITDRKDTEARIKQAHATLEHTTAQLRQLSRQLTQVEQRERERMAMVLHDHLQQLLVGVRFNVAALEQGLTDSKLREFAHQAAQTLNEAIREAKSLTIDLSPPILREGGLSEALKWLGRRMRDTHGLDVRVETEATLPANEHSVMLFNAVKELLLNVVKHAGVVIATVSLTESPGRQIRLTVADEGCGFEEDRAGCIEENGGFGLFAIRERMESMGGQMTIDSAPGKGCRVTLVAPVGQPVQTAVNAPGQKTGLLTPAWPAPTPDRQETQDGQKIRILLVDDHTVVRQGLAQLLVQSPGLEIVGEASDGQIAVKKARDIRPNVVLMDVNMPVMNGVEATRQIHAEFPEMVVIALSMYEEGHRIDEMRKAGAVAYVSKGAAAEELVASIHANCRIGESRTLPKRDDPPEKTSLAAG